MIRIQPSTDPNKALADMLNLVKTSAETTIGTIPTNRTTRYCQDHLVASLSEEQKQLRLRIEACNDSNTRKELRKLRTCTLRKLNNRLREVACQRADQLARDIASTDDSRRMFKAVQAIKSTKRPPPLTVHTKDGKCIGTDQGKANAISEWFAQQFSDQSDERLNPFIGSPRPLNQPVTAAEVAKALGSLNNGRASGPDSISNELLKYAASAISTPLANIINMMFEQHIALDSLGKGILIALPKPRKPLGPLSSLRPIVLLNCTRKVISLVALHRIREKVNIFTGASQGGFKQGRSCADLVWAQRMLIATVQCRQWGFHKMGIDMSRAFDTINRSKALEVLNMAGCNEDDHRLVRALLANTHLTVRVKGTQSAWFETSIGSPQGDSLSPVLFTCYLAAALRKVRESTSWLNPPISDLGMPLEWEYADDVDFANNEREPLDLLLPTACNILRDWNLLVNESKTEFTHIHLADADQKDNNGKAVRGNEQWRNSRSLGSLLCSSADVFHRCSLGTAAFHSLWAMWLRHPLITLQRRLRIYNAVVVSIMLYNCGSWAVPQSVLGHLDKCHRRHLRSILGIRWPTTISNEHLYIRCDARPLSELVTEARWRMTGHVLRMATDTPAQLAMRFALQGAMEYKGRRGRHQTNLLETIRADLSKHQLKLQCEADIKTLTEQATDKNKWRALGQKD